MLNLVFAAPPGERLDTAERSEAIEDAVAELKTDEFAPTEDEAGITEVGDPFDENTSRTTAGSPTRRPSSTGSSSTRIARPSWRSRTRCARPVEPVGVTVEYNGDAEFPPIEQGTQELLGLLAALIVLLVVFRTFVAMFIPIALALVALMTAFLLLFILAGLTDINTITPLLVSMIGLGVGIDYSLFIVTRFRQALHEGLRARRRRGRSGCVRQAGRCSSPA